MGSNWIQQLSNVFKVYVMMENIMIQLIKFAIHAQIGVHNVLILILALSVRVNNTY